MVRHRDLSGNDLHNARIAIEPPTRTPRYAGETVFDSSAGVLWVAISTEATGWRRSVPPVTVPPIPTFRSQGFSIDLNGVFSTDITGLSIMVSPVLSGSSWSQPPASSYILAQRFTFGTDIAYRGVLYLDAIVQRRGQGFYMPLLIGRNTQGVNNAALSTDYSVSFQNGPVGMAITEEVPYTNFTDDQGRIYPTCKAFTLRYPAASAQFYVVRSTF